MIAEIQQLGLSAPNSFLASDEATLAMITGGCGPGKFGDALVPDTMYGLSIKLACAIHDYEYYIGKTNEDKRIADLNFLGNMMIIINKKTSTPWMKLLRYHRAMTYYTAVAEGGDSFFKN